MKTPKSGRAEVLGYFLNFHAWVEQETQNNKTYILSETTHAKGRRIEQKQQTIINK
jgi:hypothetical protein